MKKKGRVIIIILVLILAGFAIANPMFGNPVSSLLARISARNYVSKNYEGKDVYVERVGYNFKNSSYFAYVKSDTNKDLHFELYLNGLGQVEADYYEQEVESGWNTLMRHDELYREAVDRVFHDKEYPYVSEICYGSLEEAIKTKVSLQPGKNYDVSEIGKEYGKITLYIDTDDVSEEKAKEVLLDLKQRMDKAEITFFSVDLTLQFPTDEKTGERSQEVVSMLDFKYDDIGRKNLSERIHENVLATEAYYMKMDAMKEKEKAQEY